MYNRYRLLSMLLLGALLCGGSPALADGSSDQGQAASTSYPFTITTGMLCKSAADLKTELDYIAQQGGTQPDVQCVDLADQNVSIDATATPIEPYKNGNISGEITKYDAPNFPESFGIIHIEAQPASDAI